MKVLSITAGSFFPHTMDILQASLVIGLLSIIQQSQLVQADSHYCPGQVIGTKCVYISSTAMLQFEDARKNCEYSHEDAKLAEINDVNEFQKVENYVVSYSNVMDEDPSDDQIGTKNLGELWTGMKHHKTGKSKVIETSDGDTSWSPNDGLWYMNYPSTYEYVALAFRVEKDCQTGNGKAFHRNMNGFRRQMHCLEHRGFADRPPTDRRIPLCQKPYFQERETYEGSGGVSGVIDETGNIIDRIGEDDDECFQNGDVCDENSQCLETSKDVFECVCNTGYFGDGAVYCIACRGNVINDGGKCIYISSKIPMDYKSAKGNCENSAMGAHLLDIGSEDEFNQVEKYVVEYSNQHDEDPADDTVGTGNLGDLWIGMKHLGDNKLELTTEEQWTPNDNLWFPQSHRFSTARNEDVGLVLRVEDLCQTGSRFAYHTTKSGAQKRVACSYHRGFADRPNYERRIPLCQIL